MSHLRIVRFTLDDGSRADAQAMADDLVGSIKQQPGCRGAWFGAGVDGECGLIVLWEDEAHADAAAVHISPKLMGHIGGRTTRPPDIHLLPVIAS